MKSETINNKRTLYFSLVLNKTNELFKIINKTKQWNNEINVNSKGIYKYFVFKKKSFWTYKKLSLLKLVLQKKMLKINSHKS